MNQKKQMPKQERHVVRICRFGRNVSDLGGASFRVWARLSPSLNKKRFHVSNTNPEPRLDAYGPLPIGNVDIIGRTGTVIR